MARFLPRIEDNNWAGNKYTSIIYEDLTVTLYKDNTAGISKNFSDYFEFTVRVSDFAYALIIEFHQNKQYEQLYEYCKNYTAEPVKNYKEEVFEQGFVRYETDQAVFKYLNLVVTLFKDHVEANLFLVTSWPEVKNTKDHEAIIRKLFVQHEYKKLYDYCVTNVFDLVSER